MRVRGHDATLRELLRLVRRPRGEFVLLSGTGGVGKSTVATDLAARGRALGIGRWRRIDVWWVSVADLSSLLDAMVGIARQLGAPESDLDAIGAGRPDGPDRVWARLEHARRRWLLVLDNADGPEVLARPASVTGSTRPARQSVGDGDGWLRSTRRGLVVVTSREGDPATWGRHARIVTLEPLGELDAARVLLDWAPQAGSESEARRLALRLGRLPLALGLAGSYLESELVLNASFPAYQRSLDSPSETSRLLTEESASADARAVVMRTWELSLDALARRGIKQARPLLRLLSCYAASTPIPLTLLDPEMLAPLLATRSRAGVPEGPEPALESGLRHLWRLRLVETRPGPPAGQRALAVHPVVADTNRAHLASDTTGEIDSAVVRQIAAGLVVGALHRLTNDAPTDWPHYRALTPHIHTLFDTVAQNLSSAQLADLVLATTTAALAQDRSGAAAEGERLLRATFPALALLGHDHPVSLLVRHTFAWEIAVQGQPTTAEAIYRDVLARRTRVLGHDHPDTISSHHELAWVTAVQGRWAEAEALYQLAVTSRAHVLGKDHPDTLTSRHELAWAMASQGRGQDAEAALRTVVDARAQAMGRHHLRTLSSRHELAWAIALQHRWAEAEQAYRAVLSDRRSVLGADHPDTLTTWHELAWTIASQGRQRRAFAEYTQVLAARTQVLGAEHADTLATKAALENLHRGKITPAQHVA